MPDDLFQYRERYPDAPGYKARDTAKAAAESMRPTAARMRELCLATLKVRAGPDGMTADEVAEALNISVLSARPRMSELASMGYIKDSGKRRRNMSGRSAIAWVGA